MAWNNGEVMELEEAYKKGLNDAWEYANKIFKQCMISNVEDCLSLLKHYVDTPVEQAIEEIDGWEDAINHMTIQEIVDTMSEPQKQAMYAVVGQALEDANKIKEGK